MSHELVAAIDCYATIVARQWARSMATVTRFAEPAAPDPRRALTTLRLLVETLAGFAIGGALGPATSRRELGAAHAPVRHALVRARGAGAPSCAAARFLDDVDRRPLVDELGARLHVRLIAAERELRALLASTAATIRAVAPDRVARFTQRLDQLGRDDLAVLRFTEQLALGWTTYAAALADAPGPTAGPWATWSQLVRGPLPTSELAGAILRVA